MPHSSCWMYTKRKPEIAHSVCASCCVQKNRRRISNWNANNNNVGWQSWLGVITCWVIEATAWKWVHGLAQFHSSCDAWHTHSQLYLWEHYARCVADEWNLINCTKRKSQSNVFAADEFRSLGSHSADTRFVSFCNLKFSINIHFAAVYCWTDIRNPFAFVACVDLRNFYRWFKGMRSDDVSSFSLLRPVQI